MEQRERAPLKLKLPQTTSIPLDLRVIIEDFKRQRARLIDSVVPACPPDPPYWRPIGADPFILLETRRANHALARGADVAQAAGQLAFGLICRSHGVAAASRALRVACTT